MQQHRQAGRPGQLQLCLEQVLLAPMVQPCHVVVQPDLAHGHGRFPLQPGLQQLQVRGPVLFQVDRVQAICRVQAAVAGTEFPQPVPAGGGNTRDHDTADTTLGGTLQDQGPVGVELGNIQMTMGIDNLHDHDCRRSRTANTVPKVLTG